MVCRASVASKRFASASNPTFSSVLAVAVPHSLSKAVAQVNVNGVLLQALVDTGILESYLLGAGSETITQN